MAVGDIMTGCGYFHSLVGDSIPHILNDPNQSLIHDEVAGILNGADLLFGNLECVVSDTFDINSSGVPPRLMGPVESIPMLKSAGFDVLNLANNHILDHGPEYVTETTELLDSYGIDYIGNPIKERNRVSYSPMDKKITFEGYFVPDPSDKEDRERVFSRIEELDTQNQLNVVSLHWGQFRTEHMKQPAPEQVAFARDLIDHGVNIILGHHSHTFQSVEVYNGGVIAYSLGNFIFDMWREKNRKSGILKIIVDDNDDMQASIIPIEQIDYKITLGDQEYIERIQNTPVEWDQNREYQSAWKKVRRVHIMDVVTQLIMNFHKFPPRYHVSTFKRWGQKARNEIKNTR